VEGAGRHVAEYLLSWFPDATIQGLLDASGSARRWNESQRGWSPSAYDTSPVRKTESTFAAASTWFIVLFELSVWPRSPITPKV
jgi:hypothetical protein